MSKIFTAVCASLIAFAPIAFAQEPETYELPSALRTGEALHAFEHLGEMGHQLDAAVASGVTVIYATGMGSDGYLGLPEPATFERRCAEERAYSEKAKEQGIRLVLGYLCATSIVKLETFDDNWTTEMRTLFKTPPAEWMQQGRDGAPLESWYGGDYKPACMNNPDWRTYERLMIRTQFDTGHDGIFFDNPTVHTKGCYCLFCMERFAQFVQAEGETLNDTATEAMRVYADTHAEAFLRFRSTIGRDFLADMRAFARSMKTDAVITANNSLNQTSVMFSQAHLYGYNIYQMSQGEDLVVVEDMGSQPRITADGKTFEYGPTLKQIHAIAHGKPVVNVTIADADYHTPPNLVRLAMAEATANDATYLVWTTWPEEHRKTLTDATRLQADFMRANKQFIQDSLPRRDVALYFPFREWVKSKDCRVSAIAAELVKANVQFDVFCEDDFSAHRLDAAKVLVVERLSVLTASEKEAVDTFIEEGGTVLAADSPDWLKSVQAAISAPSAVINGPATVRAYVRDQESATVVHLLNLNVEKLSSFEDKVTPATAFTVAVKVPYEHVLAVELVSADVGTTKGTIAVTTRKTDDGSYVDVPIGQLDVSAMLIIRPATKPS